jgi:hypothetical protein
MLFARLQTPLQVEKLIANSMDPDQTARMGRLVWIHAGRKRKLCWFCRDAAHIIQGVLDKFNTKQSSINLHP